MGLLEFVRKEKNGTLRKIFGKRELEIIEKQLLGIKLEKSETIRLSRDIRKKFELIKELSKFEKDFGIKKASNIKLLIDEAKDFILNSKYKNKIKRIYLFGSAVENKLTFHSDIDIAVEFDEINLKDATRFRIDISGEVSDKIDVQVFNVLPEKIKNEILKKGRIIYGRK